MFNLDNFRAVIFDLDGTLIDSMGMWKQIDTEFLGERNIAMPHDLQRQIEGMSFDETAVYFKTQFGLKESLEQIKDIWNRMALEKYSFGMRLKPGVLSFLHILQAKEIMIGIATSNSLFLTKACLAGLDILNYFDVIISGTEITNGKPQPDVYLAAAGKLGVKPEDCLVFEDIPNGILAGKRAGMTVCAIYDDYSANVDEKKHQLADYYIFDYNEVIP